MNRIILIGNGFDIAHNMNTSYNDFINDYWEKTITNLKQFIDSIITTHPYTFENSEIKIENLYSSIWVEPNWVKGTTYQDLIDVLKSHNRELIFKNKFIEILTKKQNEQNWVDIENEYYRLLKECFKDEKCNYKIEQLNEDFKKVQSLLESYLKEVEKDFKINFNKKTNCEDFKNGINRNVYCLFNAKDLRETSINKIAEIEFTRIEKYLQYSLNELNNFEELSQKDKILIFNIGSKGTLKDVRNLLVSDDAKNYFEIIPEEILFLNFNYTSTEKLYYHNSQFNNFQNIPKQIIHIHGSLNEENNDVIFGFGDEIDEDYKSIENLKENKYLENIKSIKYLETYNYKNLLEFINSGEYQIFIFGHSCGNSDRTLLNTLFEHENCSSIKPFYHLKNDGTDNYSDIVRNISRNFNNKMIMRDRVVNKKYCEPLSKIALE